MEKNVDVKEIAITVGIYLVLSFICAKIGNSIFDLNKINGYIGGINNGYILEFIEGLVKLFIPFVGFYAISLFSLKDKNNIKYSAAIILLALLFFTFSNIFQEYGSNYATTKYLNRMGLGMDDGSFIDLFIYSHATDIIKIIAFLMALCKIFIKPNNLSDETNENYSEKNFMMGYGLIGYIACVLIFISPFLFIGVIIGLIVFQKKKMS